MSKDKQTIKSNEVGSLEEMLGLDDPLFQPEPESEDSPKPQENNEI